MLHPLIVMCKLSLEGYVWVLITLIVNRTCNTDLRYVTSLEWCTNILICTDNFDPTSSCLTPMAVPISRPRAVTPSIPAAFFCHPYISRIFLPRDPSPTAFNRASPTTSTEVAGPSNFSYSNQKVHASEDDLQLGPRHTKSRH